MSSSDSCERTSITMLSSSSSSSSSRSGGLRGDLGDGDLCALALRWEEGGGEVLVPTEDVVGVREGEDLGERLVELT